MRSETDVTNLVDSGQFDARMTCVHTFLNYPFAVVDRIQGGKRKQWVFQLPRSAEDAPGAELAIDGNTFTITQFDASLKATFLAPPGVNIRKSSGTLKANPLSNVPDVDRPLLLASGSHEQSGDFFLRMTLQRGSPPKVLGRGRGMGTVAKAGGQTVRFDGVKIYIDPSAE